MVKNNEPQKIYGGVENIVLKGSVEKSSQDDRAEIIYNHPDNNRNVRYIQINYDEIGLQSIEEFKELPITEPVMYIEKPAYTTRQRDLEQERRNAVNNARIQQRTVKYTSNENPQRRIDYINKQVKGIGANGFRPTQRTNEAFEMGKKRINPKPEKNYEEVAELFYPNMEVKREINPPIKKDYTLQQQEQNIYLEPKIPEISNVEKTLYPNGTLGEMAPKKLYDLTKTDTNSKKLESINPSDENVNWIMPVKNYRISSNYGNRVHPTLKEVKFHDGIDLAVPIGTEVKSVADGKVTRVLVNGGYGKYIEIEHKNGLKTFYAHLSEWNVKVGTIVNKGQVIALSGNSAGIGKNGRIMTTGPHLHFGAKKNGKTVNPLNYIKK